MLVRIFVSTPNLSGDVLCMYTTYVTVWEQKHWLLFFWSWSPYCRMPRTLSTLVQALRLVAGQICQPEIWSFFHSQTFRNGQLELCFADIELKLLCGNGKKIQLCPTSPNQDIQSKHQFTPSFSKKKPVGGLVSWVLVEVRFFYKRKLFRWDY